MWITLYSCSPDASIILSHPHLHDPHTLTHVCSTLVTSLVVTNISYFTLTVYSRRRALGGRESERNSERCAEYLATARPHLAPQLPPPPPSPQHLTGALCPLPTAAPALLGARVALPRPTATRLPPRHHQRPTGAAPPHHTAARARTSGRPARPLPVCRAIHCSGVGAGLRRAGIRPIYRPSRLRHAAALPWPPALSSSLAKLKTRPGVNREPAAEAGGGCLGLAPLPPRHTRRHIGKKRRPLRRMAKARC